MKNTWQFNKFSGLVDINTILKISPSETPFDRKKLHQQILPKDIDFKKLSTI